MHLHAADEGPKRPNASAKDRYHSSYIHNLKTFFNTRNPCFPEIFCKKKVVNLVHSEKNCAVQRFRSYVVAYTGNFKKFLNPLLPEV